MVAMSLLLEKEVRRRFATVLRERPLQDRKPVSAQILCQYCTVNIGERKRQDDWSTSSISTLKICMVETKPSLSGPDSAIEMSSLY